MYKDNEFLWVEKYRPRTINECIFPESIYKIFWGIIKGGKIPNLLLSGSAGCGKTTIARVLCHQLENDFIMLNGSLGAEESGIEAFRTRVKKFASCVSFNGNRKVVIIDEADYLNPNSSQPALRALMEEFSCTCSFIFTCNYKNKIIEPLRSRCSTVDFRIPKAEKVTIASNFLKRILVMLKMENVECSNNKILIDLIGKHFPDFRKVINELQKYVISVGTKIDDSILIRNNDSDLNFVILYNLLKNKDFNGIRKWVVDSLTNDSTTIYKQIYNSLFEHIKPASIPQLIVLLADYQYKSAFCADQEINLLAMLIEIMVDSNIEIL